MSQLLGLSFTLLVASAYGEHPREPNCSAPDAGSARPLTLVAGRPWLPGLGGDGRPSTLSRVRAPSAVASDMRSQQVFFSDTGNHAVRRVNYSNMTSGVISTIAGVLGVKGSAGDGGDAVAAHLCEPHGLVVDSSNGTLYIADHCNHAVRRVDFDSGSIAVVAGILGMEGSVSLQGNDSVPGTSARLRLPVGLALDAEGQRLYISEFGNHAVQLLDLTTGQLSTVVSRESGLLHSPRGLTLDLTEDLMYVADSGSHSILSVNLSNGNVSLVAGVPGRAGSLGDDGSIDGGYALNALLHAPSDVVIDVMARRLFIADSANPVVRSVDLRTMPNRIDVPVARSGFYSGRGFGDQIGPVGLALDAADLTGFEVLWIMHEFDDYAVYGKYFYIDTSRFPSFFDEGDQRILTVRHYRKGVMIWNGHVKFIKGLLYIGEHPTLGEAGACPTCTAQGLREADAEHDDPVRDRNNFPLEDQWEIGDIIHIVGMHPEAMQKLYMAEAPNHVVRYANMAAPKPWICSNTAVSETY